MISSDPLEPLRGPETLRKTDARHEVHVDRSEPRIWFLGYQMKAKCDDRNHMDWHSVPCSVKETSADAFELKTYETLPLNHTPRIPADCPLNSTPGKEN